MLCGINKEKEKKQKHNTDVLGEESATGLAAAVAYMHGSRASHSYFGALGEIRIWCLTQLP